MQFIWQKRKIKHSLSFGEQLDFDRNKDGGSGCDIAGLDQTPAGWPRTESWIKEGAAMLAYYHKPEGRGHKHLSPHHYQLSSVLYGGKEAACSPDMTVRGQRLAGTLGSGRQNVELKPGETGSLVS